MPTPTPATAAISPSRRRLRILCAEDAPDLRRLLSLMLGRDGHSVETASDGREALAKVTAAQPGYDVVITDHDMPVMTGLELVGRLRKLSFPGRIIVFTSEAGAETRERYAQLRVSHFLAKPVYPQTLLDVVATG